jgi:hypothetical protein
MSRIAEAITRRITRRPPDFLVGGQDNPYLRRWWVILRNPVFNIYLHQFLRSDDDRALHDHPWAWCSILLRGSYVEWSKPRPGSPLNFHVERFHAGSMRCHGPRYAHRLVIDKGTDCWTLFITGPRVREWGFHCPKGWVPWQRFTAADDKGAIGAGCGEIVTVPKPLAEQVRHG